MLRIHQIGDADAAKQYYTTSDYFLETPGVWVGKGAELLGLSGRSDRRDFDNLCDNINPATGLPLTVVTRDGRRTGWDFNFNATKSVSIARELLGDELIEAAHREAVDYAIQQVEAAMETRVRIGGRDEDRQTGNLVGMHVIHRTTRPNQDDQLPDMSLHSHVVVFNATWDSAESRWKAAQIGQIKHDAPYYEAIYHNRLAGNLRELGYGIRRKDRAFEVAGISDELIKRFSRRTETIEKTQKEIEKEHGGPIGAEAKARLGATTRLHKVDVREYDLNRYWVSRLTDAEEQQLANLIGQPSYESSHERAVEFAIGHMFERRSVVDERRLYEAALRNGIGSVDVEGVQAECLRQGVLLKGGEATTRDVLAEEGRIIAFAREGRGTMRPLRAALQPDDLIGLSAEQQAIVRHIWESPDRVIMIEGDAGTSKTTTMRRTIPGIDKPGVFLAPSASASRGTLRKDFDNADTITMFLTNEKLREQARGGYIYIDEAPLAGLRDIDQVFAFSQELDARVIVQGDRKQHKSVQRGNLFEILDQFAGLPVGRLKQIWRQEHEGYKSAVASIANGDIVGGYDKLVDLGWVKESQDNKALVEDYLKAIDAGQSVLVVAPTHAEGDAITADIREKLKEQWTTSEDGKKRGIIGKDEVVFQQLKPLNWTQAERADLERYDGSEVMQFHRNSGSFRAGDRIKVTDWRPENHFSKPSHFSVYSQGKIAIAPGDTIRITASGRSKDGKHKLENGDQFLVKEITDGGNIRLANNWIISKDFGHLTHGYVSTSFAGQGQTVDRVLMAMGSESRPAINAEQFYVSASRGRRSVAIYSDMPSDQLREAIQRADIRKSATTLITQPKPTAKPPRMQKFAKRIRRAYDQLREKTFEVMKDLTKHKERERARYER
jgi:conjugative relaxase-like TrwC/TraI family protein